MEKYIEAFEPHVQEILLEIRRIIQIQAPDATESMAHGMPGYKLYGKPLVYFAAYKLHIGFYATPSGHSQFKDQLAKYKQGKGSVQFPLNQEIPYELIQQIVDFRVKENRKA